MPERDAELDALAATAAAGDTPALDQTVASGEDLPPLTGLVAGDRVDRFEILHLLGAGGMGAVFAARDTELQRKVAIKVLRRASGGDAAAMGARLLREAQAAARLSHRNVVTIYEVGTIDQGPAAGQVFVAMELIEGETLTRWHDRPQPWREVVRVYLQAARGLAAAHAAGLVHRDFKPDNALLGAGGEVKVTDFGLASVAGELAPAAPRAALDRAPTRLTSTGEVMGTPLFMAPEQRDGGAVDARADQYAFCVAVFRAVYRAFPFGFDSEAAIAARARAHQVAAPARHAGAPRALYRILGRGLSPDPAARYPDLAALIRALERVAGARRRWVLIGGVAVAVAAVAAVSLFAGSRAAAAEPCTGAAAELAGTWNAEVEGRLGAAVTATGGGGIDEVWRRGAAGFGAWGRGWVAVRTAACRATRVDRSQSDALLDRRMACLDGQRQMLAGTLALLEHPDRQMASRSAELARQLPRPEDCASTAASADPERTESIRADLRALQLAELTGKFQDQLEPAQQVLADARAVADRELEAEIGIQLGRFQRMAGDDAATNTLFDAAADADAAERPDLAVRAWAEWIYVASISNIDKEQIGRVTAKAEAALHDAGDDPLLTALLRNNLGVAAYQDARDADSERLFREALALREGVLDADDPRIAEVLDNLGNVLGSLGTSATDPAEETRLLEESLAAGRRALAIREQGLGPIHPAVARSLHNVGATLYELRRADEALVLFERALVLKEQVLGTMHPDLGTTLLAIGNLAEDRGDLEEAVAMARRTVEIWRKTQNNLTRPLGAMASRLAALGLLDEAIAVFDECASLTGPGIKAHRWRRYAAETRAEAGDGAAALAAMRELVAAEAEAYAASDVKRLASLVALGWAEVAAGHPRDGLASLDRAAVLRKTTEEDMEVIDAMIDITRAEALIQLGQKEQALTLARRAAACTPAGCELDLYMIKRRAAKLGVE